VINYIRYSLYTLYARICFIQASPWDRHGNTATYLSNTVGPTVEMNLYGVSSFEKNHVAPSCIDPHQRDSSLICGQCLLSSATFLRQNTPYLSPISCWLHISYLMMSWWFLLAESNVPSTLPWLSPQVEGVGKGIDGQQAQRWEGWARPVSGQYQASIPMFHVKMVKNGTHTRRLFLIPAQGHGHGSKSVASSRQPRWLPQFRKWFTVSF
jgi:hypothetical protein